MAPIYIGIDWSETKHDVCILNIHGAILQEFVIEQTPAGCTLLAVEIAHYQIDPTCCFIAIETTIIHCLAFLFHESTSSSFCRPTSSPAAAAVLPPTITPTTLT